jgi:hypothetical protein
MIVSALIQLDLVALECDEAYQPIATQMLALITEQVRQGVCLRDGMSIQFGWVRLTLRRRDQYLLLHEPDFSGDPLNSLRPNLDWTIDVHLAQQEVIADLALDTWSPTDCFEELVAAIGSLQEPRLIAKHYEDRAGVKGWVIFRAQDPRLVTIDTLSEQYGKLRVWQLLHLRPSLLRYLALPSGYTVFLNGDDAERIIREE